MRLCERKIEKVPNYDIRNEKRAINTMPRKNR